MLLSDFLDFLDFLSRLTEAGREVKVLMFGPIIHKAAAISAMINQSM